MSAQRLLISQPVSSRPTNGAAKSQSASHSESSRRRVLDFLASRGGSVESEDGRGITREMAKAVGYEDLSTLNAMLTRLEREGAIVREVRGRRTYRIALTPEAVKGRSGRGRSVSGAGSSPAEGSYIDDELCHPRGQLRFYLLLLINERPGHGYDLVERLRPFGYLRDDPAQTYRALHWLEGAGLVDPEWETAGPGPARRVFTITKVGRSTLERCAQSIRERTTHLQQYLDAHSAQPLVSPGDVPHGFEVLVEAKLSVSADDQPSARRKVEEALAESRLVGPDVWSTGEVWLYEATEEQEQDH
ncbi:MAG TPA: helix-turn-helix transcriptional regulator [Acidimicrobiales bacterium]|nr:helix-turn-helix transcriptional regulator [Acidimicrobiales bacterium]